MRDSRPAPTAEEVGDAAAFFDEFVQAFGSFDGGSVAKRYCEPYVALHADGSSRCFVTRKEVATYFQGVVDTYHQKGCRSCRYKDLAVVSLGKLAMLGTVDWELLRADGSVLSSWRESYTLVRVAGRLQVAVSVDHAA